VAGESFHPDAVIHQVHFERRRGHCRYVVASECIRALSLAVADPHRNSDPVEQISRNAERVTQIHQPMRQVAPVNASTGSVQSGENKQQFDIGGNTL
jgi:hypothetical protein